jgi:hemerythrin-like domain-containing protein
MNIIGSLMREHRVIENVLRLFDDEKEKIRKQHKVDPITIDISIDFIRTYTDLVHQGKEESILFRDLLKKNLLPEHVNIIKELMDEHNYSRTIVSKWAGANERYFQGEDNFEEIINYLTELTSFYPQHIQKEDEHFSNIFFYYFARQEQDELIKEFDVFDKNVLHWKYQKIERVMKNRLNHFDQETKSSVIQ